MTWRNNLAPRFQTAGRIGLALLLIYAALKGYKGGNDINVFLHAGSQFLNGDDLYSSNPFNRYLYSPLFAAIMAPLSMLPWGLARILWAFLNVGLSYRCYRILRELVPASLWKSKPSWVWKTGLVMLSFNAFNHNLILGQMTVIILWLTLEGLYQIFFGKEWKGAGLLALGMNIKIIPILAIAYIFFKGKIRASFITGAFFMLTLILPAFFIGFHENFALHERWLLEINPSGTRYAYEDNTGCVSLNCILPTYFMDLPENSRKEVNLDLLVFPMNPQTLVYAIHLSRFIIFLGLLLLIYFQWGSKFSKESLWREWSMLLVATLLILPHQMKYSMLYAIPAILLLWMNWTEKALSKTQKYISGIALIASLVIALMGRDIIGNFTVDLLDQLRFMGLALILIYVALALSGKRPLSETLD